VLAYFHQSTRTTSLNSAHLILALCDASGDERQRFKRVCTCSLRKEKGKEESGRLGTGKDMKRGNREKQVKSWIRKKRRSSVSRQEE
jgi:hypothetical protein